MSEIANKEGFLFVETSNGDNYEIRKSKGIFICFIDNTWIAVYAIIISLCVKIERGV